MIKRPFASAGFSFVFALLALCLIKDSLYAVAGVAAVCLLVVAVVRGIPAKSVYAVSLLCVLAACFCFQGAELFVYRPALEFVGENRQVEAVILSEPSKSGGSFCYTLGAKRIDGASVDYKLRFLCPKSLEAQPYDTVTFTARVYETGSDNDEVKSYFKSKRIFIGATSAKDIKIIPCADRPIGYYVLKLRSSASKTLQTLLSGDIGGLAAGMLTNDKSGISDKTTAEFSACGLSHVLAVSGLHMSIVVFSLYELLKKLFRRFDRIPAVISIFVAVLYAAVAGFSPSAVRSCIMVSVMLFGKIILRKSDSLNSLGLAALGIALVNPYAVMDLSFMLSFSATLGIVLFYRFLSEPMIRLCNKIKPSFLGNGCKTIAGVVCISLLATAFCLPIHICFIGTTSLVFAAANLLTFFAVPIVIIFGLTASVLFYIPAIGAIAKAPAFIAGLFSKYMLAVVKKLAALEYSSVSVNSLPIKVWLAAAALFVAVVLLSVKRPKRAFALCSVCLCVSLGITGTACALMHRDSVTVSAIDVSCAECFVVSHGVNAVMIGCGGNDYYAIANGLEKLGVTNIELLILPRITDEDMGSAERLLENETVDKLVLPQKDTVENLAESYEVTEDFTYDFYSMKISYRHSGSAAFCRLDSAQGSVLFTFSPDTGRSLIGKSAAADYLFSRANPPAWLESEKYKAVIISYGGTTYSKAKNACSTADNGQLTLRFKAGGEYKVY